MRLIPRLSRHRQTSRPASRKILQQAIELLESRQLMATGETVSTAIPPILATTSNASGNSITLDHYFTDSTMPGTDVTFNTTFGAIEVSLTDAATPQTVANFLSYVSSGAYNGTIFHRSAILSSSTATPSKTTPADIIQGGGYVVSGTSLTHIPTKAAVDDEYTSELFGDVAGTLAMAKTSSANSATSEWYFNENDNTQALDTPTTDSNGVTTSYTVFGKVISGLDVIKKIAELPVYNISSSLSTVPVSGLTAKETTTKNYPVSTKNLVFVNSVTSKPSVSYTVSSSNPSLVAPTLSDGVLSFSYASGKYGTADITVKASNLDGTTASTTFPVTVPNAAEPAQGPVATAVAAAAISGVKSTVPVLPASTDSVSPLTVGGVTIVSQPTNGTATVDATTGDIDYTSTSGFTGTDTLTYTVADSAGSVSTAATVTLTVAAAPVSTTIGTRTAKGLSFTQPNGTKGFLTVTGGTALVTFSSGTVTTNTTGGIVTAGGAGATISSITITNTRGESASLKVTSPGAVTLGSVNDVGLVSSIIAPTATLTGTCDLGSLSNLDVAAFNGVSLNFGNHDANSRLLIGTATNSSVSGSSLAMIKSKQWLNTDGGFYSINAASLTTLDVTSSFADSLNLSGTATDLATATVGQAAAAWQISGSVSSATLTSPASTWSLTAAGSIGKLDVSGTLQSTIKAPIISNVKVAGDVTDAEIETEAGTAKQVQQIGGLKISGAVTGTTILSGDLLGSVSVGSLSSSNIYAGAVFNSASSSIVAAGNKFSLKAIELAGVSVKGAATNSLIYSAGDVGSITAGSLSGTRIYAGTTLTFAQADTGLANSTSDVTNEASIGSVSVGKGTSTFSNSQINAQTLGRLRLGDIVTSNSGSTLGVAADKISTLSATLDSKTKLKLGPAQFTATKTKNATEVLNAYLVKKKIISSSTTTNTVNDFAIDLY